MEQNTGERKRYQGNWQCGKCGKAIRSLPFDPNPKYVESLRCLDCYKASKGPGPAKEK